MAQNEVIILIKAYLVLLKKAGIPIEKAFLYGSYARNEANQNSDIDILLVSNEFDTDNDLILAKPWLYTNQIDHRIEPMAIGLNKFLTDDNSPIIELVRKTGIEITQ